MNCPLERGPLSDRERLIEFALGEGADDERRATAAHVSSCSKCAADVAFHRLLAMDLRALPPPPVPADLEDVLVRAGIQARRDVVAAQRGAAPARRLDWIGVACALAGCAIVVVLVLLLAPGGPFSSGSVEDVVYGQAGRGTTLLNDALQFANNVRQAFGLVRDLLEWLAPVGRASQAALQAVGALRWTILAGSVGAALFVLWRLTRSDRRGPIRAARARGAGR